MKHYVSIIVAHVLIIFLSSSAYGFDGARKGFVLGGGLGFSPASYSPYQTNAGAGAQFLIGYAWDTSNMIVYEGNATGYEIYNETRSQGFNGASW